MNRAAKEYLIRSGAAMLAYMLVLVGSIAVLKALPDSPWRYLIAVAPMVPAIFALLAFLRFFRQMDELDRRIQLEGFTFSFGVTAITTFAYGFLEGVGAPHLTWTLVAPLMIALWAVGTTVARLKYR